MNALLRTEKEIIADWKGDFSQPVLSICCITYNHENYIEDVLEGFLIQETDFPFEILIHDDASTDKTADIIREYEAKYPKLITPIYQNENQFSQGIKPNWEYNFSRAKGKYVALCEGDDYWISPYKLHKQVREVMENNPDYGLVHTDILYIDQFNKSITPPLSYQNFKNRTKSGYVFWDLLLNGNFILTASVLIRKELIEKQHDWFYFDFWLYLDLSRKTKIYFINEKMVAYRRHPAGLILSNKSYYDKRLRWVQLDIVYRYLFGNNNIYKDENKLHNYYKISYILTKLLYLFCVQKLICPTKLRRIIARKPHLLLGVFFNIPLIVIRVCWLFFFKRKTFVWR